MNNYDRSKIGTSEFFKELNYIQASDARWPPDTNNEVLERFHFMIQNLKLTESVPNDIFIHFETAKNTLLYSYFSYRLSTAAMIVGLACLETAIAKKAELVSYNKGMNGLSQKLQAAFSQNWIDIRNVATPRNTPTDLLAWNAYTKAAFIPYFTNLRNELAHELSVLDFPWKICDNLKIIGRMIDELFKVEEPNGSTESAPL